MNTSVLFVMVKRKTTNKPGNNLNIQISIGRGMHKIIYIHLYMNLYTYTQIMVCYAALKMKDLYKVQ